MISQLIGAIIRAILVVILITMPSLFLPGTSADSAQVISLIAIFSATLIVFEYGSTYPCLVEFRDAPPFNRIRFAALFVTVFFLTVIERGQVEPTSFTLFVHAVGRLIGQAIDFPYSPVQLLVLALPKGTDPVQVDLVRTAAGIAYLTSLISLSFFVISLRLRGWPGAVSGRAFNVWVNLPTFDPTSGGDVVTRLSRDARFNLALGFLLPFLVPMVATLAVDLFDPVSLESPQTLVWTISAWAFLPASLFMRGIAMARIAHMITEKRRKNYATAERDGLLPV